MNLADKILAAVAPRWALSRLEARATLEQIQQFGGAGGGYEAGRINRTNRHWSRGASWQNGIPHEQINRLRDGAWDLYRNNAHARKIVRTIQTKAVGRGLWPQSQARTADGKAWMEFRGRAQQLWRQWHGQLDFRGLPGRGGGTGTALFKRALRKVILSGEVLWTVRRLSAREQDRRNLVLPLAVQLVDCARLADDESDLAGDVPAGHRFYRGIELGADDQRAAYWLLPRHPEDQAAGVDYARRYPAAQFGHLYACDDDDVDQLRGVTWFAPALVKMRDTGDYEMDELKAAAVAACVVFKYRKPAGGGQFGVNLPEQWDLTDADGNPLIGVQPGMMVNVGQDGDITAEGIQRANTAIESFLQHLQRGTAAAFPGLKGSNLTGDYRGSSFASERSNDNDVWPELESIQDWLAAELTAPLYELMLDTAVAMGLFDDLLSPGDYVTQRPSLIAAAWQGPVARSINPRDDAEASQVAIQSLVSSPQKEAAKAGRDWREIVDEIDEFLEYLRERKVPDYIIAGLFGQQLAKPGAQPTRNPTDPQDATPDRPAGRGERFGVSQLFAAD